MTRPSKKTLKALATQSGAIPEPERLTFPESQKAISKLLATQLAKAGIDSEKTDRIIKADAAKFDRILARRKAAALKQAKKAKPVFRKAIAQRAAAISSLVESVENPIYHLLTQPFIIVPTNGLQYTDSLTAPLESFAKFHFATTARNGVENLNFYYLWTNDTGKYAVVNADSVLILNGLCSAGSDGGVFPFDRRSTVQVWANLKPIELWNHPETSPGSQSSGRQLAAMINIDTSGWLDGSNFDSKTISDVFSLYHNFFLVPPRSTVAFNVFVENFYLNGEDSGRVTVDFSTGDFSAITPYVLITVLS